MANMNEQIKEMALQSMIESIEKTMRDAEKVEEDCLKRIEYYAVNGMLDGTAITNTAEELKEARMIQRAIRDAYGYMVMYTHEY